MKSSIRKSFALMVAGLGLSATVALAGPKDGPPAKSDPKPPAVRPKLESGPLPKLTPMPPPVLPKPVPKVEPIKPPVVVPPRAEPKLPIKPIDPVKPTLPKVEPKLPLPPVKTPDVKIPVPPIKTPDVKVPLPPIKTPEVKLPTAPPIVHKPIVVEKSKSGPVELPKGPGLKLPAGTKFDQGELSKIKPPIDLTKTKPEAVLGAKPPANFKAKPIKLDSIHVPKDAPVVEKLNITNVKNVTVNQQFIVNKGFYTGGDYHLKHGTKTAFGYCFPGKWHTHWHHCIWDPCFSCHYFYCPSSCGYYYWCATDFCYYPCHWFVEYHNCCYPWWICGGFGGYGYVAKPSFGIFIGW